MTDSNLRLIISGTYSTGKSTTSAVLSRVTGSPLVKAKSAREVLLDLGYGKPFQRLSGTELMTLGLMRLKERLCGESMQPSGFISDGSVLNEWVYGVVRMKIGINPGAPLAHRVGRKIASTPARPFMKRYLDAYGTIVRQHAKEAYDQVIHLPPEVEMDPDGHRPVSEEYRQLSDQFLLDTYAELGLKCTVVTGSIAERIGAILTATGLKERVQMEDAITTVREELSTGKDMLAERIIASTDHGTRIQRAKWAVQA